MPHADTNSDGFLDANDILKFVEDYENNEAASNLNSDEAIDSIDFDAFMESFTNG